MFENMTFADWNISFRPKAIGSSNIVKCLEDLEMKPWIVFLSSASGVIGNRSQANYAAGNTVQDSLAAFWNARGKALYQDKGIAQGRAVSLDLGPILGAGMLVGDEQVLNILKGTGFFGIRHKDFLTLMEYAIKTGAAGVQSLVATERASRTMLPAQVVTGVGTGGLIRQNQPADPFWTRTAMFNILNTIDQPLPDLAVTAGDGNGSSGAGQATEDLRATLAECTAQDEAADLIASGILCVLARSMNMLPEEMDASRTPNAYGVDSLVAVGVRSWVASATGVNISVLEIVGDWTVAELSVAIAERGEFGGMVQE